MTSNASIPVGTRFIFIALSGEQTVALDSVSFSQPSLIIRDNQDPSMTVTRNTDWTNQAVVVTVNANDTQSGIEGIYLEDGTKVTSQTNL